MSRLHGSDGCARILGCLRFYPGNENVRGSGMPRRHPRPPDFASDVTKNYQRYCPSARKWSFLGALFVGDGPGGPDWGLDSAVEEVL